MAQLLRARTACSAAPAPRRRLACISAAFTAKTLPLHTAFVLHFRWPFFRGSSLLSIGARWPRLLRPVAPTQAPLNVSVPASAESAQRELEFFREGAEL